MAVRAQDSGTKDQRRRAVRVLNTLEDKYGKNIYPEEKTLLEQMIFVLFAASNPVTNARKAIRELKEDFVDWNEVRVASLREIEATLEKSRIEPRTRVADAVRELLGRAFADHSQVDLEPLRTDPPEKSRRFLTKLTCLTPGETQYLELAAGLEAAPPLDEAVERVCARIGLVPAVAPASDPAKRRKLLEALAPTREEAFRFHHLLIEHAKKVCGETEVKCAKCVAQTDCDYFRADRLRKKAEKKPPAAAPAARAGGGGGGKSAGPDRREKGAKSAPAGAKTAKTAKAAKTVKAKAGASAKGAGKPGKGKRGDGGEE